MPYWMAYLALAVLTSPSAKAGEIAGVWETQDRDAYILVQTCHADRYCGRLVWHAESDVTDPSERRNRNADLRDRQLIGVPILNAVATRHDQPSPGSIYDPLDGLTFEAWIALSSINALRVAGCPGPLCRSST